MKIIAFKVFQRSASVSFDQVIRHVDSLPYQDRLREIASADIRLEAAVPDQTGSWRLDFAKIRSHGPGRAGLTTAIEDFDLNPDEGFGEETAAYYNASTSMMILQYNHYGPRSAAISSYLYRFSRILAGKSDDAEAVEPVDGFNLIPVVQPDARTKLDRMGIIKSLNFSVIVPGVQSTKTDMSKSLSSLLDNPLLTSAEVLSVEIKSGRKKENSLPVRAIQSFVADLLNYREEVTELRVRGRENEEAPSEPIDLLEARLQADIPIAIGSNRRYTAEVRWGALQQAFEAWRESRVFE